MKLKIRVLASIMSILTLSSFSQLIVFAEGENVTPKEYCHEMFATKKADANLDVLVIPGVQELIGNVDNNDDLEKLETIRKFVAALGSDTLTQVIKEGQYNILVEFGEMKSIISDISPDLSIAGWECNEQNHITITNNSGNNIKAHIGVEFDDKCSITGISLAEPTELSNIALPNGATEKRILQLSGGKIKQNLNLDVFNNLFENKLISIGNAKVFITGGGFIESSINIANKLKEYADNTKALTDKVVDKEIKDAGADLFEAANNLPTAVEKTSKTYTENVNKFVENLNENGCNLKNVTVSLPDCQALNQEINKFIDANKKLTSKVNAKKGKPVNVEGGNSTNNPNGGNGDKQGDGTDPGNSGTPGEDGRPSVDSKSSEQVEGSGTNQTDNNTGSNTGGPDQETLKQSRKNALRKQMGLK